MAYNILQLVNRVPFPLKDGGAIHTYNVSMGYKNQGCHITMLAINTLKHRVSTDILPSEFKEAVELHTVEHNTNVTIWGAISNLFTSDSYNISRFYETKVDDKLREILCSKEFDFIHIDCPHMGPYIDTIRQHSKAKVILKAHNVEHRIWERMALLENRVLQKHYFKFLAKRLKKYEEFLLNEIDALVTMSKTDAQIFVEMGCKIPVFVSPAGINVNQNHYLSTLPMSQNICFIGSLDWKPNLESLDWFLQNVWPIVYAQNKEVKFKIAGRKMPAYIKDLKLPNIEILGEVDSSNDFMTNNGILIVPLRSGSGIRIKIIEAMSLGRPIISTTIGAEGIDVESGTHLLLADSENDFAYAILTLLKDEKLCRELAFKAKKLAYEKYSSDKIMQRLLGFYTQLKAGTALPSKKIQEA